MTGCKISRQIEIFRLKIQLTTANFECYGQGTTFINLVNMASKILNYLHIFKQEKNN